MLRLSKSLFNQPVISLRSGGRIGLATQPIINPHNLKILGWWCKTGGSQKRVLLAEDVRGEAPRGGLAVNDEADLSLSEELVRHKEVLDIQFELLGKPVRTKRRKLGKVSDYSYNEGMFVQKLYVVRPLHKVFTTEDTLLIDRAQILEVTDNYILVRDTEVTDEAEERSPAGATAPAG